MDLLKRNLPAVAGIVNRFKLARIWRREFLRVRAELEGCSERQLKGDLRLFPSEIAGVAAEAADQHVTAFVRNHPDYRGA